MGKLPVPVKDEAIPPHAERQGTLGPRELNWASRPLRGASDVKRSRQAATAAAISAGVGAAPGRTVSQNVPLSSAGCA